MTEFVPNLRSFRGGFMNDSNGKAMGYIVYSGYMLLRCVAPRRKKTTGACDGSEMWMGEVDATICGYHKKMADLMSCKI